MKKLFIPLVILSLWVLPLELYYFHLLKMFTTFIAVPVSFIIFISLFFFFFKKEKKIFEKSLDTTNFIFINFFIYFHYIFIFYLIINTIPILIPKYNDIFSAIIVAILILILNLIGYTCYFKLRKKENYLKKAIYLTALYTLISCILLTIHIGLLNMFK